MDRDWSLIVGHQPGWLGLILIVACVGLALLDVFALVRRPPSAAQGRRGRARVLGVLGLRLAAIACLLAVVFELQVRVRSYAGSARRVVVLIDRSASMDIADGPADAKPGRETTRRWDRVRARSGVVATRRASIGVASAHTARPGLWASAARP